MTDSIVKIIHVEVESCRDCPYLRYGAPFYNWYCGHEPVYPLNIETTEIIPINVLNNNMIWDKCKLQDK